MGAVMSPKAKSYGRRKKVHTMCHQAVSTGDYLFTTMTTGQVHCMEVATGNIVWVQEIGTQYPSPVLAKGLCICPMTMGLLLL